MEFTNRTVNCLVSGGTKCFWLGVVFVFYSCHIVGGLSLLFVYIGAETEMA
jgi:hypothetical protein